MPVKPSYLVLAGAGGIIVFAGIKGWGISHTFRDVLKGENPSRHPKLINQIGGGPETGPGVPQAGPTPTGSEVSWITSFLITVGAPPTPANIRSVTAWIAHEGDFATSGNNPLNTTQTNSDSIGTKNSVGVQIFRTPSGGVNANATALLNGQYGDILLLLRSGQGLCGRQLQGLAVWSGGGYNQVC